MTNLNILSQELIATWTKVLEDEKEFKPTIKTILEEHLKMEELDIKKPKSYPFIQDVFEEFVALKDSDFPYKGLLDSIKEVNDSISWYPNTTFKASNIAVERENYCANLAGKIREMQKNPYLFHSDDIISGLFVMGPEQFYPAHSHPAWETWVIISGESQWKIGDNDWKIKKPGEHFTLVENEVHSTKTGQEPLLALWAWTGDFSAWAEWV